MHLLYAGHSRGLFELRPGLAWPEGSWAFAGALGGARVRHVATVACVLAAVAFVVAGVALSAGQGWWRAAAVGSAVCSSLVFVLLWDGSSRGLSEQGGIAVIINAAIVAGVSVAH